jgi:chaperonin cofactor prefoldin
METKLIYQMDEKLEKMETKLINRMDEGFERLENRIDRLEKKFEGLRIELTETQETVDYLSSKSVQHEKKLRTLYSEQ